MDSRVRARAVVLVAAACVLAVALAGRATAQSADPPLEPEAASGPALGTTTPIRVVSLRAGPNGETPVIGTLHPGDRLEMLATANYGWTQVRSASGTGWAYGSYLASGINPAGISPVSAANPGPGTNPPLGMAPQPVTSAGFTPLPTGRPSSAGVPVIHGIVSP